MIIFPLAACLILAQGTQAIQLPLVAEGMSGDGRVVSGYLEHPSFPCLWQEDRGVQLMAKSPMSELSGVVGLSVTGSVAYGLTSRSGKSVGCLWVSGKLVLLGDAGFRTSMSGDGSTLVGNRQVYGTQAKPLDLAFRWRERSGFINLERPASLPDWNTYASGCSADGSTVVGFIYPPGKIGRYPWIPSGARACIWDRFGVCTLLPNPKEIPDSAADACSDDGAIIVGNGSRAAALRWDRTGPSTFAVRELRAPMDPPDGIFHARPRRIGGYLHLMVSGNGKMIVANMPRSRVFRPDGKGDYWRSPVVWFEDQPSVPLLDRLTHIPGLNDTPNYAYVLAVSRDSRTLLTNLAFKSDSERSWLVRLPSTRTSSSSSR